ncbi:MAG: putative maleylacetoacetate isomerase MaiA [Pseudomonadota bacterium]|jgi:maleylacetoacetate isomerase/maleylpyruvate isomerase
MKLYNYFRSSASYRVRIALALKGLDYDYMPVHLAKNEQLDPAYSALSSTGLVPLLQDGEHHINQSLAIIEYLEETHPTPSLLPAHPAERARVRALALDVACEIHPLNNLRVLRYLVGDLKLSEDDKNRWYRHWVEQGLAAVERQLESPFTGRFCHGETPTLADVVLVPQIFNAQRFNCQLSHVPKVMQVFEACMLLDAFSSTQPANCPDAQA